ncbi:MAG: DrmB family protein [Elainella sp.]
MPKKTKSKPSGELRQSQVLTTFGPGSMVDLPTRSVIIGGLSFWKGERQFIREDRLRYKVAKSLQLDEGQSIQLYAPPQQTSDPQAPISGIDAFVFPTWFLAQVDETYETRGKIYRTRPLVSWSAVKGGLKFEGKNTPAVPVRFVQACTNGHLSDIDWYGFAHQDFSTPCRQQLWLDEGGSGNDFEEIFVRCECGKRRPLSEAKLKDSKVLGACQGHRPWLGSNGREACQGHKTNQVGELVETGQPEPNRLLVRSASNAYFTQILSVISMPDQDAELKQAVDRFYEEDLQYTEDLADVKKELKKPKFSDLAQLGAELVWKEIQRRKSGLVAPEKSIKQVELEALLACPEELGKEAPASDQVFQGYSRRLDSLDPKWHSALDRVVLVHRLREVSALIGFTRFEAAMPNIEGEIDDLAISIRRANLDFEQNWVPAIENLGEGVFISIKKAAIQDWLNRPQVKARAETLEQGYLKWLGTRGISQDKASFPGAAYIMLHSLSHLLITAVSLDCGYASSAIRERIYAFDDIGYGILLHTGTSGSEGTLGGLVEVGRRIEYHLGKALDYGRLCSNDPVCAQHRPDDEQEDRLLHGAACHGCLLIAETSCERRNEMLDRALVVSTVAGLGAEFFPDALQ